MLCIMLCMPEVRQEAATEAPEAATWTTARRRSPQAYFWMSHTLMTPGGTAGSSTALTAARATASTLRRAGGGGGGTADEHGRSKLQVRRASIPGVCTAERSTGMPPGRPAQAEAQRQRCAGPRASCLLGWTVPGCSVCTLPAGPRGSPDGRHKGGANDGNVCERVGGQHAECLSGGRGTGWWGLGGCGLGRSLQAWLLMCAARAPQVWQPAKKAKKPARVAWAYPSGNGSRIAGRMAQLGPACRAARRLTAFSGAPIHSRCTCPLPTARVP